jgi:hypothetical protein
MRLPLPLLAAVVVLTLPTLAQTASGNSVSTTGKCSPSVVANRGTVTVICKNLDPETAKQIQEIGTAIASMDHRDKATAVKVSQIYEWIKSSRPLDPDIKRLQDAQRLSESLDNWDRSTYQGWMTEKADVIADHPTTENPVTHRGPYSQEAQDGVVEWRHGIWWKDTLKDYQQSYATELVRLKTEMLAYIPARPAATTTTLMPRIHKSYADWQNPTVMGEIGSINDDFFSIIQDYRNALIGVGKLPADGIVK